MSWIRAQHGAVEECTCVNSQTECRSVAHTSKTLFWIAAVGLHGVGIKGSKNTKASVVFCTVMLLV